MLDEGRDNTDPLDEVFDALGNQRRRYVLACLSDHERPLALADLAACVAEREHAGDGAVPKEVIKEVRASLHHVHVPKLEVAGLIEQDRDRNVVAPVAPTDVVELVRSAVSADGNAVAAE